MLLQVQLAHHTLAPDAFVLVREDRRLARTRGTVLLLSLFRLLLLRLDLAVELHVLHVVFFLEGTEALSVLQVAFLVNADEILDQLALSILV